MSRFQRLPLHLQQSLQKRSLLKVISGLSNFDKDSVLKVARSSKAGGADLIDVACDPLLVNAAKEVSDLPICVSSVEPALFENAIEAGAAMVEIGNFDSFYSKGRFFERDEIISIAVETRMLFPDVFLSVTVPHFLPLDQQSQLAIDLVEVGADLIQTEGGTSSNPKSPGTLGLIEKAAPTLAAVHAISESFKKIGCDVPLLCASGLSVVTAPMAFSVGASGVGVGSAVNRLNNELEMVAMVLSLRNAINSSLAIPYKSKSI